MKITDSINITKHSDGSFSVQIYNRYVRYDPTEMLAIYEAVKSTEASDRECVLKMTAVAKAPKFKQVLVDLGVYTVEELDNMIIIDVSADEQAKLHSGVEGIMKFFTEFQFNPNFRFMNSIGNLINGGKGNDAVVNYISNYFRLLDSPYAQEIKEKVKSSEFKAILDCLASVKPTKVINDRLKIYFGSAGTGKTTQAMRETDDLCVVCNSSMLPADLMEDFTFDDGKAAFHPSALARCMEEGKPIVLDEINLLPFDSLRFLQGIFDGKKEFQYKGNTIHINDGFKVIGTMNLVVNGVAFGLPEPLVDRCSEIKEFELTADNLMGAF